MDPPFQPTARTSPSASGKRSGTPLLQQGGLLKTEEGELKTPEDWKGRGGQDNPGHEGRAWSPHPRKLGQTQGLPGQGAPSSETCVRFAWQRNRERPAACGSKGGRSRGQASPSSAPSLPNASPHSHHPTREPRGVSDPAGKPEA